MLSPEMEKQLVDLYLRKGVAALELKAVGRTPSFEKREETTAGLTPPVEHQGTYKKIFAAIDTVFSSPPCGSEMTPEELLEIQADYKDRLATKTKELIATKRTFGVEEEVCAVASFLLKKLGVKITEEDARALSLKFMHADRLLLEAEGALLRGDWSPLEQLREKVNQEQTGNIYDFKTVIDKYQPYYLNKNPNLKPGTKDDMLVECRVLLEIIGNIGVGKVNTLETVTSLKQTLQRYPKNKQQRYGDRSVHSIIRTESGYDTISQKTANQYIARLGALIDFANKSKMLNAVNVVKNENFKVSTAAEDQRLAYDASDIDCLINAICNEKLWAYDRPKPERFWIILIALFHGLRLGNIVTLTKKDICQTDSGLWIFNLTKGKTQSTVRPVAICDSLLLLGFLEWVEQLGRSNLFQDSSPSFSRWYNRDETKKDGQIIQGFEARYVTRDKKKCLYSLRHNFAGHVFEITGDFKITADMMGHSTGRSVTARYTKVTRAQTLKEIQERMHLDGIDLDKLERRAKELFFSDDLG